MTRRYTHVGIARDASRLGFDPDDANLPSPEELHRDDLNLPSPEELHRDDLERQGPPGPPTRWYTFGYNHVHAVGGFTYDKDVVVQITAPDPRAIMLRLFGQRWSMEYASIDQVKLDYYPRGVKVVSA